MGSGLVTDHSEQFSDSQCAIVAKSFDGNAKPITHNS